MNKKIFLIAGVILLTTSVLALAIFQTKELKENTPYNILPSPEAEGKLVNLTELGFSIILPQNFLVEENGQYSRLFLPNTNQVGQGPANFLYISVIPISIATEEGTIYNYSKSDVDILRKMKEGETKVLGGSNNPDLNQYFTYQKIDNIMLGGYGTKAFFNSKPWEFPNGTTEYRYLVEFSNANYLIGGYVSEGESPGVITKQNMDDVFSTLKIFPEMISAAKPSPIQENNWKTYTNDSAGLTFNYPENWLIRKDGQNFPDGDLFNLYSVGESQRPQTEFYDGVNFAVMKPVATNLDTLTWMKERYEKDQVDPDRPPKYEKASFGGFQYDKVTVCGLGCFPYYHTKQNGRIYGFLGFAVGPNEDIYEEAISKILSSVKYK